MSPPEYVLGLVRRALNHVGTFKLSVIVLATVVLVYGVIEWLLGKAPASAAYAACQAIQWNLESDPEWAGQDSALVTLAWCLRFAVPVAFGGVLAEALSRLDVLPRKWFVGGHVIVVGAGDLGTSLAKKFHEKFLEGTGRQVVVIERNAESRGTQELRAHNVWVITGCGSGLEALRRAGAGRADQIVFVTGDDYSNCQSAMTVVRHPKLLSRKARLCVQVTDKSLRDSFESWLGRRVGSSQVSAAEVFNSYQVATGKILSDVYGKTDSTKTDSGKGRLDGKSVAILGFGKLGQAVLSELLKRTQDESIKPTGVRVFERDASKKQAFDRLSATSVPCSFHQSDLCESGDTPPPWAESSVVIVCTDSEARNLDVHLRLQNANPRQTALVALRNYSLDVDSSQEEAGSSDTSMQGAAGSLKVNAFSVAEKVWAHLSDESGGRASTTKNVTPS